MLCITPDLLAKSLVSMQQADGYEHSFTIDLVYAQANHPENIFGMALYRADAQLWLHRDLAKIVTIAAALCFEHQNRRLILKDGLRPVEAQAKMLLSDAVRQNPQWLEDKPARLLSPPGTGAHPRGMAIDLTIEGLDMGTEFDALPAQGQPNLSARSCKNLPQALSEQAYENRMILEKIMLEAADRAGHPLLPLPSEWWDFRFPKEIYEACPALSEADLSPAQKML